jgi:hypothetical protein
MSLPLETDQNMMIGSVLLYYRHDIFLLPYFSQLKTLKNDHVTRELYSQCYN